MNSARNVTDRTKNMNARIITALLALLGFGAACSGVKETAKSTDSRADSVRVQRPIRLMYGVPVREFQARPLADSARGEGRLPSAEAISPPSVMIPTAAQSCSTNIGRRTLI